MTVVDKTASKVIWGDIEDDNGEYLDFLLPPRQVIGPDESGLKKTIEYKLNDDGKKVKVTSTTRVRMSSLTIERRSWPKFGDAVQNDVDATMVSTEEIRLERPCPSGDSMTQLGKGTALMVCRTCGKKGDHWTIRCPYKDLAPQPEDFVDKSPTSDEQKGAYVPPNKRQQDGSEMKRRNEENSVRVTNLSEDTREPDLRELFCTFGNLSRVRVVIDQKTKMSRGFGFVNFVMKEDAERAIAKLDGYGYDNLILRVEWDTPREN